MTLSEFIRGRIIVGPWTGDVDVIGIEHRKTGDAADRFDVHRRDILWPKFAAFVPDSEDGVGFDTIEAARQFVDDWIRTTGCEEYVLIEDIARAVKDGSVEV